MIQGIVIAGAAGLALSVGAFFYGRNVESDIQEARYTKALLAETEKTLAAERKYQELSNEVENELRPKLARAESDAVSVARRLREYKARSCPLSSVSADPNDTSGTPGESPDIAGLEERHYGACARDSQRLSDLQLWYNALRLSTQHGQ